MHIVQGRCFSAKKGDQFLNHMTIISQLPTLRFATYCGRQDMHATLFPPRDCHRFKAWNQVGFFIDEHPLAIYFSSNTSAKPEFAMYIFRFLVSVTSKPASPARRSATHQQYPPYSMSRENGMLAVYHIAPPPPLPFNVPTVFFSVQ